MRACTAKFAIATASGNVCIKMLQTAKELREAEDEERLLAELATEVDGLTELVDSLESDPEQQECIVKHEELTKLHNNKQGLRQTYARIVGGHKEDADLVCRQLRESGLVVRSVLSSLRIDNPYQAYQTNAEWEEKWRAALVSASQSAARALGCWGWQTLPQA